MKTLLAWVMLVAGLVGFAVTFPLWLFGGLSDRAMLGITLVLSWAALWYAGYVAILEAKRDG